MQHDINAQVEQYMPAVYATLATASVVALFVAIVPVVQADDMVTDGGHAIPKSLRPKIAVSVIIMIVAGMILLSSVAAYGGARARLELASSPAAAAPRDYSAIMSEVNHYLIGIIAVLVVSMIMTIYMQFYGSGAFDKENWHIGNRKLVISSSLLGVLVLIGAISASTLMRKAKRMDSFMRTGSITRFT